MLAEEMVDDLFSQECDELCPRVGDIKKFYCQDEKRFILFEYCELGYWVEI